MQMNKPMEKEAYQDNIVDPFDLKENKLNLQLS